MYNYDFIVIGSGVGGSTVLKELSKFFPDKRILLIEKGDMPQYAIEEDCVDVLYSNSLGGAVVFSVGNAIRIKLKDIKIEDEIYEEIEKELNVSAVPMEFINDTTKRFFDFGFERTPKYIDFSKCNKCGMCAHRPCDAKWTPLDFIKKSNADIIINCEVINIKKDGDIFSVECIDRNENRRKIFKSKKVIVSAGGIDSPRILSSILDNEHLGKNLFVDTFVTVGGILKGANFNKEVPMSIHKKYKDFILATHYSMLLYDRIKEYENVNKEDIIGFMVKIKDESVGEVGKDYVKKPITKKDAQIMSEGVGTVSSMLSEVGIDRIYSTIPRGSHPGGTCAVGKVVDKNFETEVENLFVCDASVFSEAPGAPPILAIIGIGKKLANYLKTIKS
ncbi:GMC family oxidoreductase N-terminal domain-containing protein [Methanothermococcus thermolithotrophicus]|uniref:GMC family oxidoreductase N-terminal domain-containing protein n=1 Tax=Methanothermococcus thermolithotrophicus TaxID=2186 RepID=UPI0003807F38|nr:GMC family oxidoreductase N-terminal domain-containing protein [Methanothermococcus thermolithotrophicus]